MKAQFIPSGRGQLFTLYFPVESPRGAVICLPPFCEEMNRTRALMAQQARQFANAGFACLLFDFFGTGDSAGQMMEADWSTWLDDANTASNWLTKTTGHLPILWGIRLGGLLAAQLHHDAPDRFQRLLLWHPVTDGRTYMTQMLRLRVAALATRNQPPEKTSDMRAALQRGETVEISGYEISGKMACAIDETALKNLSLRSAKIDWLEPVAEGQTELPVGVTRLVTQLTEDGCQVRAMPVVAPAIWLLSDRADASAFISSSLDCLNNAVPSS